MGLDWPGSDFWNTWNAISIGLTGLFGIMGLLTSYKDNDTGRITVWGRINLAGIILSAVMGVASQLYTAQREAISSAESAKEAVALAATAALAAEQANVAATQSRDAATNSRRLIADVLKVSKETEQVARGTERSVANSRTAAQAGQQAASRTLGVARDTAQVVTTSQAGLVRIEKLLSPFVEPTIVIWASPWHVNLDTRHCPDESGVPLVGLVVVDEHLEVIARYHGKGKVERSKNTSDPCGFRIEAAVDVEINKGFKSYLDIPGKTIYVTVSELVFDARWIQKVVIRTADGSSISPSMNLAHSDEGDNFRYVKYEFPSDFDPRD